MRPSRSTARRVGAGLASAMAIIYFGIGLGVLDIGANEETRGFLIVFGALAGGAFLMGAILLTAVDRRWLWVLGTMFQIFVIWAYIDVSKTRTPPFEMWGILLRIIQVPLLAVLGYLALRPLEPASR